MRGCAWEHIWLSIHIHQSRWFPWAPSLCSAKWSAEALLTYNRFREFTAFYNSTTGIGWVRMSYAPAMYVKKFSQCLNLSRHRMGSERAVVLRSGVTDVGKAYKVNSKSTWHLRWRCDVSPHKLRLCMRRTKSQGFRVDCGGYPCWTMESGKCKFWIYICCWNGFCESCMPSIFCVLQQVLCDGEYD